MDFLTDMLNKEYKILFLMTVRAGRSRLNIVVVYTNRTQNILSLIMCMNYTQLKTQRHDFLQLIQMNHTI